MPACNRNKDKQIETSNISNADDLDNRRISNKRSPEEWAQDINKLCLARTNTVFEIGDALLGAQSELSKTKYYKTVGMTQIKSKQNANNYIRVARNEYLRKSGIIEHLPTSVGALIDLAACSPSEIDQGIRLRVIRPNSERAKIRKWRRQKASKEPAKNEIVLGRIMSKETYDVSRLWKSGGVLEKVVSSLDEDMFIRLPGDDIRWEQRRWFLSRRLWKAYETTPNLFLNRDFDTFVKAKKINCDIGLMRHLQEVAPFIASGDHKELHKVIKFSKADWRYLGVRDVGFASLQTFIDEQG